MPKISVILPSYNGEKYIAQSIQSVIDQTEQDWELIIVNDCSTDGTLDICKKFAAQDKRIKVVSNKINKKLPGALNVGFALAHGKYLTWTSDDNWYKPNALKILSQYLDTHPQTDLISMDFDFINDKGKFLYSFDNSFIYERCTPALLTGCNIGAAFMYRKSIADQVGEYDTNTFCAEDYDYWCRIALVGKIDYAPDNIYVYRFQPNSLTATKQEQILEKTKYIQRKYAAAFFERFHFTESDKTKFYVNILKEGDYKPVTKIWRFIVRVLCCSIFWAPKMRRKIRAKLLANNKFSFSRLNKGY